MADGRRLRRDQNRTQVITALLELYAQGTFDPSAAEIAAHAGLSARSLFRYFDSTDDLARAAAEVHLGRAAPLMELDVTAEDPLPRRVEALVTGRLRLWDEIAPGARAARLRAHRIPVVAEAMRRNRAALRRQIESLFAPELAAMDPDRATAALAAADVMCSFDAVELLLHDQRLDPDATAATMATTLLALFDHAPRPPALETTGGAAG